MSLDAREEALAALAGAGCCSHMCTIMPPHGMGTNGPCRCLDGMDPEKRRALRRALSAVRRALAPAETKQEERR